MNNLKFKNKYRIPSSRLPNWDYTNPDGYFITICTKDRESFFGNIDRDKIVLSEIGLIAEKNWLEIPKHFENCKIAEYVVMPNHIHGILFILEENVKTHNYASLLRKGNDYINKFGPQRKNISSIIRAYKGAVKKYCNDKGLKFDWQSRFYDHIIRNETDLFRIYEYILNNPINWNLDKFYV